MSDDYRVLLIDSLPTSTRDMMELRADLEAVGLLIYAQGRPLLDHTTLSRPYTYPYDLHASTNGPQRKNPYVLYLSGGPINRAIVERCHVSINPKPRRQVYQGKERINARIIPRR